MRGQKRKDFNGLALLADWLEVWNYSLACLSLLCFFCQRLRAGSFIALGSLSSVDEVQLSSFFLCQASDDRTSQQGHCVVPPKPHWLRNLGGVSLVP